jgi:hypothetical protein
LLRQRVLLGVGALGVVGLRHLRHQRDLRGAAGFLGGQVARQRGVVQALTRPKKSSSNADTDTPTS